MNLTVKHIGSDGSEHIMSCGSFFAERNRSDRTVTYCAYRGTHRGTELLNVWSGTICHSPEENQAVIYVVNENGSTVAIHRYSDEDYMERAPRAPQREQYSLPLDTPDQPE